MSRLFPHSLKDVIEKASRPILKKRGFSEARIISDWHGIVGKEVANYALPLRIQFLRGQTIGGTLTISTHPAYALEIQQLTPQILEKIASYFGYRAIERIVIEQQYHALPSLPETQGHIPNDTSKQLSDAASHNINVSNTSDDPLDVALKRLEILYHLKE